MRDIKFRGKRLDNGEWVEGCFCYDGSGDTCIEEINDLMIWEASHVVDPATVGQYTGLIDKNGKMIFEGDVVTFEDSDGGYEYQDTVINSGAVVYGDLGFYFTNRQAVEMDDFYIKNGKCEDIEIIGNIHDNPELMEARHD